MKITLFGPQGAGKGTQSARISEKYDIPAIATGDIFRWAISKDTELGRQVREYVESGRLVPDELTIKVVRERLEAEPQGWLLEGFPRNRPQAQALDKFLGEDGTRLHAALVMEVPEEVSLRRILGRRVCSNCGRNYHVDAPPRNDWICDRCGGKVEARIDDQQEQTIRHRLKLYHEQTQPLKSYYDERGMLRVIDGLGTEDEVFDRIVAAL